MIEPTSIISGWINGVNPKWFLKKKEIEKIMFWKKIIPTRSTAPLSENHYTL
jgi:hypothetical protein